jgi:hypothetical protein
MKITTKKMNLSQILIEAGVTPDCFRANYKFAYQDNVGRLNVSTTKPIGIFNGDWMHTDKDADCVGLFPRANDWQTPLSLEQFIADYETHNAKRP